MLACAVGLINEKNAAGAVQGFIRGALFEQAHLRNADLAQRSVGGEGEEVRMGAEKERIVVALVGGKFFAGVDQADVVWQAEVVALDLFGGSEKFGGEAADEGCFADAFETGKEHGLRDASAFHHAGERGLDVAVAPKVFKHWFVKHGRPQPHGCGGPLRRWRRGRQSL